MGWAAALSFTLIACTAIICYTSYKVVALKRRPR